MLSGDDIMRAVHSLGFGAYTPTLEAFVNQYRTSTRGRVSGADVSEAAAGAIIVQPDTIDPTGQQ